MINFLRRVVLVLIVGAVATSTAPVAAKNLGPAKGPNGLPWSLALDCSVGEPARDVTVSTDGVYLREAHDRWVKLAAQPVATKAVLRSWKLYHPDGRLGSLALLNGPGTDGLSNHLYTYRFDLTLLDVAVTGGCDRLPDGARPANVVNVDGSQLLAIRATPSATGATVASVGPGSYLWKKQAPDRGAWIPVFARLRAETGTAKIASGWVTDPYLGRLR